MVRTRQLCFFLDNQTNQVQVTIFLNTEIKATVLTVIFGRKKWCWKKTSVNVSKKSPDFKNRLVFF